MKKIISAVLLAVTALLLAGIVFLSRDVMRQSAATDTAQNVNPATQVRTTVVSGTPAASEASSAAQTEAAVISAASQTQSGAAETAVSVSANAPAISAASSADSAVSASESAPSSGTDTLYTADIVNVRSQPNTDSAVLGKLTIHEQVKKTGESGEWTQIDYNGQTAFVKTEYLSATKESLKTDWDLSSLSTEEINFGYSSQNRDENNVPTDWEYYDSKWGQFAVKWIGDTSKKVIYLTMDEGFPNTTTPTILDTLKEKNVKATFMLTKYFLDGSADVVKRMIDEGHQIGDHTCTHPDMAKLSVEEQKEQIMGVYNEAKDQFGYEMKYFRFPEGIFSAEALGLVNNLGMESVFWSYAYNDYDEDNQPDVQESLQKALDALHPGAIYLLHASSTTNTAMLGDFIDGVRARGYEFGELKFLE